MSKEHINKWRKTPTGRQLYKRRNKLKTELIKYGLLPIDYPYSKTHEELIDLLKCNKFDEVKKYSIENRPVVVKPVKKKTPRKKYPGDVKAQRERQKILQKEKTFYLKVGKLQSAGLLPTDIEEELTDQQKDIIDKVKNGETYNNLIEEYINDANIETKQKVILQRLMIRSKHHKYIQTGHYFNLNSEDIIINEYCPFLGTKIDYRVSKNKTIRGNGYSVDRFKNEKSYVKGNVWVISRLANIIKNDASLKELKSFCINIIKKYETN
jgi:hypothetical protein